MTSGKSLASFTLVLTLLISLPAQAVVGTIVVSLGRTSDARPIEVGFSADARVVAAGMTMNSKINYQSERLRDQAIVEGQQVTIIQRYDLGKTWILMTPTMYMEHELGTALQAPDYTLVMKEAVGEEVINGVETTKYETIYQSAQGRFGGFTWVNEDNIAVKGTLFSETGGKREEISFELTNLDISEQPEELFELPAGANKFDMSNFGGMMNSLKQQYAR